MQRKQIIWTQEKSNRLYDYIAEMPCSNTLFFGYQVNEAIFNIAKYFVILNKNIKYLDYGCGGGDILKRFLKNRNNINVYGVDMSPECVRLCNEKFSSYDNFCGVKIFDGNELPFEDNTFDFITVTEVIEHILPVHKDLFFYEVRRILKPNGIVLITTPNEEDFKKNEILCPECNTVFHKHGHCNRFSSETLTLLMSGYGFQTILCAATDLYLFQEKEQSRRILDYSIWFILYKLKLGLAKLLRNICDRNWDKDINSKFFQSRIGDGGNLLWVGRK